MKLTPQQYNFTGSPDAMMAAANAHAAHMGAAGQIGAAQASAAGQAQAARANAAGMQGATLFQQPANFANVFGNAYNAYAGGVGGAYNAYAGGLGNLATAASNERSNLYGSQAMAEAARQGALGNIGSAGIGAYGSMGNAAMDAWARNQQAYNQALATMQAANQSGISNYGAANAAAQGTASAANSAAAGNVGAANAMAAGNVGASRAGAVGQIGAAQATADGLVGRAGLVAGALGGLFGGTGGGSFNATGVDGPIASGSFSGLPGGGGFAGASGLTPRPTLTQADLFGNDPFVGGEYVGGGGEITDPGVLAALQENAAASRQQLDGQHMSSREMPASMMGLGLAGLMGMTGQSQDAIASGMDQFYANQGRASDQALGQFGSLGQGLGAGYAGALGNLATGYADTGARVQDMWDGSMGLLPPFMTPARQVALAQEGKALRDLYRAA